ncbi:MAG: response regulator transcription factor [Chloroflexota bacterium]|nr:response regulator transcription factor [Chloroflexota bacterium]
MMEPIRVLLVDDHELVRAGLRLLIEAHERLMVVGESDTRNGLCCMARKQQPDIIVLDVDDNQAIDIIPELRTAADCAQLIVLTEGKQPDVQHEAVYRGAQGIVLKEQGPAVLWKAIQKVYEGEVWMNRSMMARVLDAMRNAKQQRSVEEERIATLTEREREVIVLIGDGMRNQEIAARLHISESTVGHHLSSIYSKLDVSDRLELLIFAYRHRIVDLPR